MKFVEVDGVHNYSHDVKQVFLAGFYTKLMRTQTSTSVDIDLRQMYHVLLRLLVL